MEEKSEDKELVYPNRVSLSKRPLVIILIFLSSIIILFILWVAYLQISYHNYENYDDSIAREKYSQTLENFNNLERYHLEYSTSRFGGSTKKDIYYIKDKLFLREHQQDNRDYLEISIPGRVGMGISQQIGYTGECTLSYRGTWPRTTDLPCLFETGFISSGEPIPINLILDEGQSPITLGKTYLKEENINEEKIFCFDTKTTKSLFKYSYLYGPARYIPGLITLISKLPPKIENYAHLCYTEKGVLVETSRGENFGSITYNFDNSIFDKIPHYTDFNKFIEKIKTSRESYYKIVIGDYTTYFKDFNNYLTFSPFEGINYFTSGCSNGLFISYNTPCTFADAPPYSWINLSFYPLKFLESKTIAGQNADCFAYHIEGKAVNVEEEFCIMDGGYVISEKELRDYKEGTGPAETSYEASEISSITEKEYLEKAQQAHY